MLEISYYLGKKSKDQKLDLKNLSAKSNKKSNNNPLW